MTDVTGKRIRILHYLASCRVTPEEACIDIPVIIDNVEYKAFCHQNNRGYWCVELGERTDSFYMTIGEVFVLKGCSVIDAIHRSINLALKQGAI